MRYSTLSSETDTWPRPSEDVTWEQFCELFKNHTKQPTKSGRAFIPANTRSRRDSDIRQLEAAVFDLEGPNHAALSDEEMRGLLERLQELDFILHTTYSGHGHYRLIVRLSAPVPVKDWAKFWESVVNAYQLPADPACKNPSRIYFLPSSPDGGGFTEVNLGHPLDVGAIPEGAQVEKAGAPEPRPEHGPIDLNPLRKCLKGLRKREAVELADKILSGRPLAESGARDVTINRAAALVATASDGASLSAVLALLEPSIAAMDCAPEGLTHWLAKAKNCYERALKRVEEKKVREAGERALFLGVGGGEANEGQPATWVQGLIPKTNKEGEVIGLKDNEANVALILTEDKAWKDKVRFNELTKQIDLIDPPVDSQVANLDVNAAIWLQRSEYRINPKPQNVGPVLFAVARRNSYDPLAEYHNSLRWDGKARAKTFFREYFGCDDTEHISTLSERWLISAVARALEPGCKVDTVLILEAGQGAGKSKALHALASPFFTDAKINVYDKDSQILANMVWLVELAELTSMKKAESESLKAFFSEREGFIRPPYGRVRERFPRRAVFVGSTNQDEYLFDTTGNRRYWPVRVSEDISTENIMADRDQIWAEAGEMFRAGAKWWLTKEEAQVAETHADERLVGGDHCAIISDWLLAKEPANRPPLVRMIDVLQGAFARMPDQINEKGSQEVSRALRKLGFKYTRKRLAQGNVRVYETPKALLEAAKQEKKGVLV